MRPLIHPGKWYYVAGVAFLVIAGFAGFRFYQQRTDAVFEGLTRVVVPGAGRVVFPASGHGAVFLEYRSIVGDRYFLTPDDLGGLSCTLVSRATGAEVELHRAWLPLRYALDLQSGRAVFDFWVDEPGTYELRGTYPQETVGGSMVLSVGYGLLGDLSGTILGGLAAVAGLVLAGVVWITIVAVMRGRSRREIYGRFGR